MPYIIYYVYHCKYPFSDPITPDMFTLDLNIIQRIYQEFPELKEICLNEHPSSFHVYHFICTSIDAFLRHSRNSQNFWESHSSSFHAPSIIWKVHSCIPITFTTFLKHIEIPSSDISCIAISLVQSQMHSRIISAFQGLLKVS